MTFAFWPAAETVERFNRQVLRCGTSPSRRIGIAWVQWVAGAVPQKKIVLNSLQAFQHICGGFCLSLTFDEIMAWSVLEAVEKPKRLSDSPKKEL